jgi:hypothetical protein
MKGIRDGALKAKKINVKHILERALVISSIPSTFKDDIPSVLWDQFFKDILLIKN